MIKITAARITAMPRNFSDPMPAVYVTLEGSTEEQQLFDYYPDEISFSASEFVGLTLDDARGLKFKKDRAYLAVR